MSCDPLFRFAIDEGYISPDAHPSVFDTMDWWSLTNIEEAYERYEAVENDTSMDESENPFAVFESDEEE